MSGDYGGEFDAAAKGSETGGGSHQGGLGLELRPEQRLIQAGACERFVDLRVSVPQVAGPTAGGQPTRNPLALALVLDRSGSMQGEKLGMAKRAALAVIDRLEPRDRVAVVIFDDRIETIQPAAAATDELKSRIRSLLSEVGARSQTALHEGWLTGCNAIAADESARTDVRTDDRIERCFLLTDGLANVGMTDPEQIAAQSAGVREQAGISTSTFGIGLDYSEELLGPMAEAGSGAFHHLRTPDEIANTFVGELGQLFTIVARQARLELEAEPGMSVEVISGYYAKPYAKPMAPHQAGTGDATRWSVVLGDLVAGDEHHVVARVRFPARERREQQGLRARLVWVEGGAEHTTDWRELAFTYASDADCSAEPRDATVQRYAAQHLSDHAMRSAIRTSKTGDLLSARQLVGATIQSMQAMAPGNAAVEEELKRLRGTARRMASAPLSSAEAKEAWFHSQVRSSGKKDLRGGTGGSAPTGNPPADSSQSGGTGGASSTDSTGGKQP